MIELVRCVDAADLARRAAALVEDRLRARPDLAMAVPAGRTPRGIYARLRAEHGRDTSLFSRMRVFAVDELCPPAPTEGYFWRQIRAELLDWTAVPAAQQHPFRVDAPDLELMCAEYEREIAAAGGLDLAMLGLGPNAHLACNEPGSPLDSPVRTVELHPDTIRYVLSDDARDGVVSSQAVTLGLATILAAREVVVIVSGAHKRAALAAMLDGAVTEEVPASVLHRHPRCTVLASCDALEKP
jgi:glucosamine-6-phosphate deaminase